MQKLLEELLAKKACEEVLVRYGRTLDWLDEAGQAACYWPDAQVDYGFFTGAATAWVPFVMELERASLHRWHACHSILIRVDAQTARSECYGLTAGSTRLPDGSLENHLFGGRYLDHFECREGEWRINQRRYVADWAQTGSNILPAIIQQGFAVHTTPTGDELHNFYQTL